jgi:hypothetical protein
VADLRRPLYTVSLPPARRRKLPLAPSSCSKALVNDAGRILADVLGHLCEAGIQGLEVGRVRRRTTRRRWKLGDEKRKRRDPGSRGCRPLFGDFPARAAPARSQWWPRSPLPGALCPHRRAPLAPPARRPSPWLALHPAAAPVYFSARRNPFVVAMAAVRPSSTPAHLPGRDTPPLSFFSVELASTPDSCSLNLQPRRRLAARQRLLCPCASMAMSPAAASSARSLPPSSTSSPRRLGASTVAPNSPCALPSAARSFHVALRASLLAMVARSARPWSCPAPLLVGRILCVYAHGRAAPMARYLNLHAR